ncbi:MAG: L,D-transpeptidase [Eubacteriales bacterium]|nr:L,D-transpeptidase [Eubacteriales bacterium]
MNKKKKKNKVLRVTLFMIVILIIAGISGFLFYNKANRDIFAKNTNINGYNMGGKTIDTAFDVLNSEFAQTRLIITENEQTIFNAPLCELGFSLDRDGAVTQMQAILKEKEEHPFSSIVDEKVYNIDVAVNLDEELFGRAVVQNAVIVERVPCENAYVTYDETGAHVTPEVYGTTFRNEKLQPLVKEKALDVLKDSITTNVEVALPSDIYDLPEICSDDPSIIEKVNQYNKLMNMTITYQFGTQTEVLDWSKIKDMTFMENDQVKLNDAAISEYLTYTLEANYNTIYYERTIQTSYGTSVTLPSNDYGYQIDHNAELALLKENLYALESVAREPVYAIKGYQRNGRDDLCGTYVEVNLSAQHLWFYINGGLVVESDFVSGLPTAERETVQGAFPMPYKESPSHLVGAGVSGNWDVTVQYWMPFCNGQGLHDASWRSSFGGTIYQSNGSHGCVNLPTNVAAVIYENIQPGMPIILYK